MTPLDRTRLLFTESRAPRTTDDVVQFAGVTEAEARAALAQLQAAGEIRATGVRKFIPVRVGGFERGNPRRTDHDAESASILTLLPARMVTLAAHLERSPSHVGKLLRAMGCVCDANNQWHRPGSVITRKPAVYESGGGIEDERIIGGGDVATWVEVGPTKAGFDCERRGQFVTHAQCHDDYTTAASGHRACVVACKKCPRGERQRMEYARGGW